MTHSNSNLNHSNQHRRIRMRILTIRKGFECKFEPFKRYSEHSNAYSKFSPFECKLTIWMRFETFECKFWKRFKAFECKFEPIKPNSNGNSNPSNEIQSIRMHILTIEKGFSNQSNANSDYSYEIRKIRMQIQTIQKEFDAFECKFKPFEAFKCILKGILTIQMHIWTIPTRFETFECKF